MGHLTPRNPLPKPLDQPLALQPRQPLNPAQAVQLIDFMPVADRAQAKGFLALQVAVGIAKGRST
jgi:hypothetical protein